MRMGVCVGGGGVRYCLIEQDKEIVLPGTEETRADRILHVVDKSVVHWWKGGLVLG